MANQEQVAILKKGVVAWNAWRAENPEVRVDLSEAILGEMDLTGAALDEAILYRANLDRANLTGADLYGADLYAPLLVLARPRTSAAVEGF